jgi:hypothetical protein
VSDISNDSLVIAEGRNSTAVLEALAGCHSFADVRALGALFHGTCEELNGNRLQGGGYDNVFWTAESPSVAQAYIPSAGITSYIYKTSSHRRQDYLSPTKQTGNHPSFLMRWALERSGKLSLDDLDITWDGHRATSHLVPDGWPTLAEVDEMIESLGYIANEHDCYEVNSSYRDGKESWFKADRKMPGQLIIAIPKDLKIEAPGWSSTELGNANHNRISDFERFEEAGVEAFRMSDQLQSKYLGNVEHTAIGLTPVGVAKCDWIAIPAYRNDGDDLDVFLQPETEEFTVFMKTINPRYGEPDLVNAFPKP